MCVLSVAGICFIQFVLTYVWKEKKNTICIESISLISSEMLNARNRIVDCVQSSAHISHTYAIARRSNNTKLRHTSLNASESNTLTILVVHVCVCRRKNLYHCLLVRFTTKYWFSNQKQFSGDRPFDNSWISLLFLFFFSLSICFDTNKNQTSWNHSFPSVTSVILPFTICRIVFFLRRKM